MLGGTLLISGTMIGVGMLALPVATGPGGFLPAIAIYLLCWVFMLCTGLLLLEVCSWMPKDANLISMAHKLMGPFGKNLCWIVYLFLFISVMIAHIAGGGNIVSEISGGILPPWLSMILYVLVFSPVIYLGTRSVDRLNLTLMVGVAISYFLFVFVSYDHVDLKLLTYTDWPKALIALPILFTAFTYQVIIPSLMTYMDRDVKKVRRCIILGTSIPLVIYLIWELLILGIVPTADLIAASKLGHNAVMPLKQFIESSSLFAIGKAFAFFTMTTSYIALSLAYIDFLADGLKVKKQGWRKIALCFAIFAPPTLISLIKPDIFLHALSYAGGFSCAILFGLFPPVMVWIGRYVKGHAKDGQQIPGGKGFLSLLIAFVIFELFLELGQQFALL
jgi:tyrosine-specific transport protein